MRMDQYIGLNDWAKQTVQATQAVREVGARILPGGKVESFDRQVRVPVAEIEVIGKIEGAWNDHVADLHRYKMPNGSVFEEYVQETPWSGGPCYFIALKNKKGNVVRQSLWSKEELDAA